MFERKTAQQEWNDKVLKVSKKLEKILADNSIDCIAVAIEGKDPVLHLVNRNPDLHRRIEAEKAEAANLIQDTIDQEAGDLHANTEPEAGS